MNSTQIGLKRVGDGDVLVRNFHALDLLDLVELLANLLRFGGYGLHEDITTRYTAGTVDQLIADLDSHASLLRCATDRSTKDTP